MVRISHLNLQVYLTNECNLKCTYCFQEHFYQSMDIKALENSMKELISFLNPETLSVMFCGGEPFLEFSKMKDLVAFLWREFDNLAIEYYLTTNGTLLDWEIIDFIIANNISISISVDGSKEVQDRKRLFKNGKGSFEVVDRNIRLLKEKEIPLSVKTTISDYKDVKSIYEFIKSTWNPSSLFISECVGDSNTIDNVDGLDMYYRSWKEILDLELRDFQKTGLWSLERFSILLCRILSLNKEKEFCDAGNGTYCIFLDGSIYPCYRAIEFPELKIDMENMESRQFVFKKLREKKNKSECCNCDIRKICGGCCLINAYKFGNRTSLSYELDCQLQRIYGELTILLLSRIKDFSLDGIRKILKLSLIRNA